MIGSFKRRIPPRLKAAIKRLLYLPLDGLDVMLGKHDELQPPRRLVYIGNGDFRKIGQNFLKHFMEVGQLQAQEAVLDVGCGIGRMAMPLTRYLKEGGLNAESLRHLDANAAELNFQYEGEGYRTIHKTRPEYGLALYEEWVGEQYKTNGLRILEPIRYGSWCGRGDFLSQQDIIVAVKE